MPGYTTQVIRFPDDGVGIAVLMNDDIVGVSSLLRIPLLQDSWIHR